MTIRVIKPKLKYPRVHDGNKVSYLLLHLAVPSHIVPRTNLHLRIAHSAASTVGIKLSTIIVEIENSRTLSSQKRYLFRFPYFRRQDIVASRFADAVLVAVSITHGPFLDNHDDISNFRIPMNLIQNRRRVSLGELIQIEENRLWGERITEFPATLIGSGSEFSDDVVEDAWRLAPLLFNNDKFLRAFHFLKTSQENFFVWPGNIDEAINASTSTAENIFQQSRLENALQDSFKTIEAILGDPPKDDEKLFHKIRSIGVDPNMVFGLKDRPIFQVIRDMNVARDKKAAHGSTIDGLIMVGDLLDYQNCARYMLLKASDFETVHNLKYAA